MRLHRIRERGVTALLIDECKHLLGFQVVRLRDVCDVLRHERTRHFRRWVLRLKRRDSLQTREAVDVRVVEVVPAGLERATRVNRGRRC